MSKMSERGQKIQISSYKISMSRDLVNSTVTIVNVLQTELLRDILVCFRDEGGFIFYRERKSNSSES